MAVFPIYLQYLRRLGGHGVQVCSQLAWDHTMHALSLAQTTGSTPATWSIGGSQQPFRRRSSRLARSTSARTASSASAFGTSCTTPLSTSGAKAKAEDHGSGESDRAVTVCNRLLLTVSGPEGLSNHI